ncbi:MAG TPA: hypothetical protein PKV22_07755, partial [Paludibacteraceae bacterium]|nr:hypothetical protein [Paludibacteraceae bacterium]
MLTENVFYIHQTVSTNVLCWKMLKERDIPEGFVVVADYQTAGKGQAGNYDIVFTPLNFVEMFNGAKAKGVTVVGVKNVMSA